MVVLDQVAQIPVNMRCLVLVFYDRQPREPAEIEKELESSKESALVTNSNGDFVVRKD